MKSCNIDSWYTDIFAIFKSFSERNRLIWKIYCHHEVIGFTIEETKKSNFLVELNTSMIFPFKKIEQFIY